MRSVILTLTVAFAVATSAAAQQPSSAPSVPPGYVIGVQDVLQIVFWRDKDMSTDAVMVRPDGKISLPLLNEIQAAGLTPEQLHAKLIEAAGKFVVEIEDSNVTVIVKDIRSRNVFITGYVAKPGAYPLTVDINVLQFIALAGGLLEYSDAKNIKIIRTENGRQQFHNFNYSDVIRAKNVGQNIMLKPGDTVVVP